MARTAGGPAAGLVAAVALAASRAAAGRERELPDGRALDARPADPGRAAVAAAAGDRDRSRPSSGWACWPPRRSTFATARSSSSLALRWLRPSSHPQDCSTAGVGSSPPSRPSSIALVPHIVDRGCRNRGPVGHPQVGKQGGRRGRRPAAALVRSLVPVGADRSAWSGDRPARCRGRDLALVRRHPFARFIGVAALVPILVLGTLVHAEPRYCPLPDGPARRARLGGGRTSYLERRPRGRRLDAALVALAVALPRPRGGSNTSWRSATARTRSIGSARPASTSAPSPGRWKLRTARSARPMCRS